MKKKLLEKSLSRSLRVAVISLGYVGLPHEEDSMADLAVSIIIITYNHPFLLNHCLERVLAQSYTHNK